MGNGTNHTRHVYGLAIAILLVSSSAVSGDTWTEINSGLPSLVTGAGGLAIDSTNPSTLYSWTSNRGLFKSTDGGASWKVVRAGIPTDARVNSFVIDPASPSNVYANIVGGGSGVIKSTDHGETWNVLDTGIPAGNFVVSPVVMDPEHPSTIYFGYVAGDGVGGVSKSTDGGASWYPANAGRNFADVRALAIHPVDTNVLYTAAGADGVFKSVDSGENWTRLAGFQFPAVPFNPQAAASVFQAGSASIRSLVIDSVRPNILYALTGRVAGCHSMDRVLLKSTDGGTNWSDASPPLSGCSFWNFGNAVPMVVDPTDPDTLYVGADFGDINGENPALLKTTDGGTSWSAPQGWGCCAANALAVDPTDSATLYGGTWSGVMKSIDGGATWSNTGLSIGVNVLVLDPVNPSIVYAAADTGYGSFGGLFKSTDSGASWFAINNGLASLIDTRAPITALVVDPARPQTIYAGTAGYGVFKSTDGGGNWNQFNDGLMSPDIRALTLAPATSSTLYAVTTKGVFAVREPN